MNANEAWNSLDLKDQSNLECARAWFIEGFAHGNTAQAQTLTDEEVTAEYLADLLADSQDPDVRRAVAMLRQQQAEIEKLQSWVEMLVEVPFFEEIDHYRGIPIAIIKKAQQK